MNLNRLIPAQEVAQRALRSSARLRSLRDYSRLALRLVSTDQPLSKVRSLLDRMALEEKVAQRAWLARVPEASLLIGPRRSALVDREMNPVVEPGAFEIYVGGSSASRLSVALIVE